MLGLIQELEWLGSLDSLDQLNRRALERSEIVK